MWWIKKAFIDWEDLYNKLKAEFWIEVAKMDKVKQREIDRLNQKIEKLEWSRAALKGANTKLKKKYGLIKDKKNEILNALFVTYFLYS